MRRIGTWLLALTWSVTSLSADLAAVREHVRAGRYDEALEALEPLAGEDAEVAELASACFEARGRYEEAESALKKALETNPDASRLWSASARLSRRLGRFEESLAKADLALQADPPSLGALWERVGALDELGRQDEIVGELERFVDAYNERQPTDAETLLYVALGAAEHARRAMIPDQFDFILNTLLVDARAADPTDARIDALAGRLLLEKYNKGEAVPLLNKSLQTNSSYEPAIVDLGMSARRDFDFPNGFNFAKQALDINPRSVPARCLQADLLVLDERVGEALTEVEQALAVNPHTQEALGRKLACLYLSGKVEEADALEKEVLARTNRPGVFYARAGELLEERRQFPQAERLLQRAIELAPHLAEPRNHLGMLYMRVGKEDEARAVFGDAFERDPFHVRVSNMKKVLKHLEGYQVLQGKHYELKVHGDQDGLLGRYMLDYLDETHEALCRRFGYEPPGLTKIEVMRDHQWFSARVVGLPSIGTVGACTGDVVALASPQGLQRSYNWARVLTHEVTHVITLQQTHYHIPHWYTEALAVISEGYPRPQEWNELLADRVPKRDLLNLDTINHAFVRPKTPLDWQMAYCQSQLYALYMQERFGEDALARLLNAYRDGMPTETALRAVFGVEKRDFEKGYVEHLDRVVASLGLGSAKAATTFAAAERAYQLDPKNADLAADLAVHYLKREKNRRARELADEALAIDGAHPRAVYVLAKLERSIGNVARAVELVEAAVKARPNDELLDLLAAIRIEQDRFAEAAALYESARAKEPFKQKWVEGLVRMYLKLQDLERLIPMLEALARMDAENVTVRQKRAEIAFDRQDWATAARWAREAMYITIKPIELHEILGRSAKELGDRKTAIREYEVIYELRKKRLADGIALARVYAWAEEPAKAKALVLELRKSAPEDADVAGLAKEMGFE